MEKVMRIICCILLLFLLAFTVVGCRGIFYYSNHSVWISEDNFIKIDFDHRILTVNRCDEVSDFNFGYANDGSSIEIYDESNIYDGLTDEEMVLYAEAEEKKNRLYLTFTLDKLFDLEGKTVILDPVTSE